MSCGPIQKTQVPAGWTHLSADHPGLVQSADCVFVDVPSGQEDLCPEGGHPELARQSFEDHVFMCFCVAMDTDGHAVGLLLLSCLKIVASVCLCVPTCLLACYQQEKKRWLKYYSRTCRNLQVTSSEA